MEDVYKSGGGVAEADDECVLYMFFCCSSLSWGLSGNISKLVYTEQQTTKGNRVGRANKRAIPGTQTHLHTRKEDDYVQWKQQHTDIWASEKMKRRKLRSLSNSFRFCVTLIEFI